VWLKGLGIVQSFESCGLRYPDSCDAMIVDTYQYSSIGVRVKYLGSRLPAGVRCRVSVMKLGRLDSLPIAGGGLSWVGWRKALAYGELAGPGTNIKRPPVTSRFEGESTHTRVLLTFQ